MVNYWSLSIESEAKRREVHTEKRTDREMKTETHKPTDREANKQTDRDKEREAERQKREMQTDR